MAALVCDICGGKLVAKAGGLFECEYCGMQYDKTRIQEMVQEIKGTVKVEGTVQVQGTVAVDTKANKENLLKRIEICAGDRDFKKMKELIEEVLNLDPECGEAYLWQLLANLTVADLDALFDCDLKGLQRIEKNSAWQKALQYSAPEISTLLKQRFADVRNYWERGESPDLKKRYDQIQPMQDMMFQISGGICCLKADGTVLVAHEADDSWLGELATWTGIKKIVTGDSYLSFVIGLRWDGTILLATRNADTQTKLREICNLTDVKDIAVHYDLVVALTKSGKLVATSNGVVVDNWFHKISCYYCCSASGWTDVEHIHIVRFFRNHLEMRIKGYLTFELPCTVVLGITKDGHVRCADSTEPELTQYIQPSAFEAQKGVIKIGEYGDFLLEDGRIWKHGSNTISETKFLDFGIDSKGICEDTSFGRDIIAKNDNYGLRADGRIVASKLSYRTENVNLKVECWEDIVAFADCFCHELQLGLCENGEVLSVWKNEPHADLCLDGWKLFDSLDTFEQERDAARRLCLEDAEKRRIARVEAEKAEKERIRKQRIETLTQERKTLQSEHSNLKGLFTAKRRKEIEARLLEIENELKGLN